jgi:hypothetical protein
MGDRRDAGARANFDQRDGIVILPYFYVVRANARIPS